MYIYIYVYSVCVCVLHQLYDIQNYASSELAKRITQDDDSELN